MNKLSFLLPIVALSLAACSSCAKKQDVPPAQPPISCEGGSCPVPVPSSSASTTPPPPTTDVISQENWEFTLTGPGWVPQASPTPDIKAVFKNKDQKLMVFLVKEPTTATFPEYVIGTIRAIRSSGVTIDSAKQVTINGNSLVLATVSGDGQTLYAWITAKAGFGYALSCGGPTNVDAGIAPCQAIADTLKIQ